MMACWYLHGNDLDTLVLMCESEREKERAHMVKSGGRQNKERVHSRPMAEQASDSEKEH